MLHRDGSFILGTFGCSKRDGGSLETKVEEANVLLCILIFASIPDTPEGFDPLAF